jgi:AmmeMemoRadiSam system protein B
MPIPFAARATMNIRLPRYAGSFYESSATSCRHHVERLLEAADLPKDLPRALYGGIVPHAGWVFSGEAAAHTMAALAKAGPLETVVLFGTDHRGAASGGEVFDSGLWRTPLGDVAIDEELARAVKKRAAFVKSDATSHAYEHSIEVQVPFLQRRRGDVKIVPICIGEHDYGRLAELGAAIGAAVKELGRQALVVASSDMTHYESAESASRKDRMAIERMLAMDEEGLWRTVERHGITMCGVAPAVATIAAARALGASEGRLVKYMTSGDITGDNSEVVGYASIAFTKETE